MAVMCKSQLWAVPFFGCLSVLLSHVYPMLICHYYLTVVWIVCTSANPVETLGLCVRGPNSFGDFVLAYFSWAFLHEDLDLSVVYLYMYSMSKTEYVDFWCHRLSIPGLFFFSCVYHFSGCLSVKLTMLLAWWSIQRIFFLGIVPDIEFIQRHFLRGVQSKYMAIVVHSSKSSLEGLTRTLLGRLVPDRPL